jgi:hypothetical protein
MVFFAALLLVEQGVTNHIHHELRCLSVTQITLTHTCCLEELPPFWWNVANLNENK